MLSARSQRFSVALTATVVAASLSDGSSLVAQSDSCSSATPTVDGGYAGDTSSATNDGEADCGDSFTSPDVWYSFTAPSNGDLSLETCGSGFDTVLSVHSACPGSEFNQLACNDDDCGTSSRVAVSVVGGATYRIRVAGWEGATGPFVLDVGFVSRPPGDLRVNEFTDFIQLGRVGSTVACALASHLCNVGGEPLDWIGNPDPRHPFIAFNMYRLRADRFEQIGLSWVKHGIGAQQVDDCGLECFPHPDNSALGVGCRDTYVATFNGVRSNLGPRDEVNPWTGAFTYEGSYLDIHGGSASNALERRLQLYDADLDPAANPGASYFCEIHCVSYDDSDPANSIGWEPVLVSGAPGGTWSFDNSAVQTQLGPALDAWAGALRTVMPQTPQSDGRCILAAKATDNGDGTWHYEYALYNRDMDRQVGSFTIPVAASTAVSNVGFRGAESSGEVYTNDPWTWTRGASNMTWATVPYAVNPNSNPVRWGTLYNFRFDADVGPADTSAVLGLHRPGTPATLSGLTRGPAVPAPSGDMDDDGDVDLGDVALFQECFTGDGGGPVGPLCVPGDFDGDTDLDLDDFTDFLAALTGPS